MDVRSFDPQAEDLAPEVHAFDLADEQFSLLRAASLLPRTAGLPARAHLVEQEVGVLAELVRAHPEAHGPWPGALVALLDVLFGEDGFRGDTEEYDDPENSFLDRVLERRRGLPIALSVLVREIARGAGLAAHGVGFPGHFLVAVEHERDDVGSDLVVIDPFHAGRLLAPADLERMLSQLGGPTELLPEHLAPASDRAILVRMLVNLRGSFARRRDPVGVFRVLSRLLLLRPQHPEVLAERAVVRRDLLDLDGARDDAEAAVAACRSAEAPAARRARRVLEALQTSKYNIH